MNLYSFGRIPVIDPKDIGKIIGTVTTDGIMKLLTETKRKLGLGKYEKFNTIQAVITNIIR
jgi:hypothetical protein